jgi:hypothetical protein
MGHERPAISERDTAPSRDALQSAINVVMCEWPTSLPTQCHDFARNS